MITLKYIVERPIIPSNILNAFMIKKAKFIVKIVLAKA